MKKKIKYIKENINKIKKEDQKDLFRVLNTNYFTEIRVGSVPSLELNLDLLTDSELIHLHKNLFYLLNNESGSFDI